MQRLPGDRKLTGKGYLSPLQFVVGLGNVGEEYTDTPHNLGRELVEYIQSQEQLHWRTTTLFDYTPSTPAYARLNTYMNLSGKPVAEIIYKFGCAPEQILTVCDDFTLPTGMIRIRKNSSAGSHNGLKSIIQEIQSDQFPRLRLGIGETLGSPVPNAPLAKYVLAKFNRCQLETVRGMFKKAAQAIQMIQQKGLEAAMNKYNEKVPSTGAP